MDTSPRATQPFRNADWVCVCVCECEEEQEEWIFFFLGCCLFRIQRLICIHACSLYTHTLERVCVCLPFSHWELLN